MMALGTRCGEIRDWQASIEIRVFAESREAGPRNRESPVSDPRAAVHSENGPLPCTNSAQAQGAA